MMRAMGNDRSHTDKQTGISYSTFLVLFPVIKAGCSSPVIHIAGIEQNYMQPFRELLPVPVSVAKQ